MFLQKMNHRLNFDAILRKIEVNKERNLLSQIFFLFLLIVMLLKQDKLYIMNKILLNN